MQLHAPTALRRPADAMALMSTDDFTPRERAPQWCEWLWKHFGGLHSDLYGDTDFDGHLSSAKAGDVILTRLEANRHRVVRTMDMVRASGEGYLKIVAPMRGSAGVEQDGRQAWVRPGAWTIYDTTGSYAVANPERVEHLIVMVPKAQLAEHGLRLESLMARPVGGATGIARVALTTMRSTFEELPNMSSDAAQGAGELITQLVRLSLIELAGQHTQLTQREALKDRIRGYVALHLRDPKLSADQIATALNCSKRHLYNAFADEPHSLASYIQHLRLDACLRALQQDGGTARPITDIAMHWGFNNLSHFSRVFRERTGQSPSEFRHASGN
ncbi:helix-turn-helix domain-containing protein [Rhodoferax saidenbachensis]|uniref:DNA-binding protein n=1 Tax=Rhodoferax saidenbachensis TaxID=1484693 RepID=A0A1P8K537_9BURK|nr:helix-turn-helix domain-containing protein [Rhodoferax saidenbachensis]APW41130.1 DNA-binding protein [Rhodoferax saidenbachensis]